MDEGMSMTLSEALLRALKARGANHIFGIPGDFALPFFKVVEESGVLPLYTLSHEPGIGFAADAAARIGQTLGVAAVTYGAGAFNLINAVNGAYAEKSPLVVIASAPGADELRRGLLLHHQGKTLDSQMRVYRHVTCARTRLDDAEAAPGEIARVLNAALAWSLPVYIEIPRDMATVGCTPVPKVTSRAVDQEALAACAGEILDTLAAARAPVLMAGVELKRFRLEDKAAALAARLALPVVTSFMGRGLMVGTDPAALGTYHGVAGDAVLTALVEESDALFLIGVIPSDTNFGVSEGRIDLRNAIHALDRRVMIKHHVYPDIPLGDLMDALLDAAKPTRAPTKFAIGQAYPTGMDADDSLLTPTDIACAVNDMMATHGPMPIASDIGDCLFTAMDITHTDLTGPGYYAGMGYGVPAGLGVQIATGKRPLILVGDGAFQMTGWELGNCRRYELDPIIILFNNCGWEMLRVFQPESQFNDLGDWRFADMAPGMGGNGVRVKTRKQLQSALEEAATSRGKFFLIEAMLEPGRISQVLEKYVSAVARAREST